MPTRRVVPLVGALLLWACSHAKHVSPEEFKRQYAAVGQPQTMHAITYAGERDGKAFIRVRSMSTLTRTWSDELIYVEFAELDPAFRNSLPQTASPQ
jgi:hypothetical protein